MKKIYTYLREISLIIALLIMATAAGWGQEKEHIENPRFPRKALVQPECLISNIVNIVKVGATIEDLACVVDDNIDNYATFGGLVNVQAIEDPVIRVKDLKYFYPGGTNAGFCVQINNGSLLSLELVSIPNIIFYNSETGEEKSVAIDQGQDGGLLGLDLLQLPGDPNGVSYLSAKAPADFEFDEIGLFIAGVKAGVAETLQIRYAFVGDAQEHALTTKYHDEITISRGSNSLNIANKDRIIDEDTTNISEQPSIVLDFGATFTLKWDEEYEAGTEVGFVFENIDILDLKIAESITITVEDAKGNSTPVELGTSVLGVGLISVKKTKVSISAPQKFNKVTFDIGGFGVSISGRRFYYGFVCKPTEVPHHHHLNATMSALIGNDVTGYTLSASEPVIWSLISVPNGEHNSENITITPIDGISTKSITSTTVACKTAKIEGMTAGVQGTYTFEAKPICDVNNCNYSEKIELTRGQNNVIPEDCRKPIYGDNIGLSTEIHESSGSLLSVSGVDYEDNIIDDDMSTYAEYKGGLSLIENLQICGVKKIDGNTWKGEDEDLRVGYVMESTSKLLDLDLLQFFQIRLYKNGEKVFQEVVDETDVLSLGLAGENQMAKVRYGVTVPKDIEFDEITLWKSGILSLNLTSAVRIYGAFMHKASLECYESPLGCGSVPLNVEETDTYLDYNHTGFKGLAQVNSDMLNLENVIDNDPDMETAATVHMSVGVGVQWSIGIKLGKYMDSSHRVAVVLSEETYAALASVASSMTVALCRGDQVIQEVDNWQLVGVDVIGYGDKQYIFVTPNKGAEFDGVRITYNGLVSALKTFQIYGVAVSDDLNRNGIPDCSEDPNILNISLTSDICLGDRLVVVGSGEANQSYEISSDVFDKTNVTIDEDGNFMWEFIPTKAGNNIKLVIEAIGESSMQIPTLYFTVHPKQTTWKKEIDSKDWNEWTNWTEGSPWTCTDVIIPSDANTYPVLESGVMNGCRYIHFEPNAEVVNTHRLTYEKAWVELALHPNRYYMVTVPLKDTYSGDWFIPQTKPTTGMTVQYPEVFSVLDAQSLPENRVTPTVYQRVWAFKTYNKFFDAQGNAQKETLAATTHWSAPYNYLATPYDKNEGGYDYNAVSVWVHPLRPDATEEDNLDDLTYTFRFPKEHTLYQYYDEHGTVVNAYEPIKREQPGRFIYESKDSTFSFPDTMRFYANSETEDGKKLFLVGNPFMSHIDLTMFLLENPHITSIKIEGSDGNNYTSVLTGEGGTGIITVDGIKAIAPMQSFFVIQESDAPSCSITFTENMLISKSVLQDETGLKNANIIRLTASVSDTRSSAMIRFSASASDNYREREDAEILIENETPPAVAIFTTVEDRALDIQQRANGGEIPLGMYLPKPEDVTLRIAVPDEYSGWMVEDVETNRRYPLMPGEETEIHVGRLTTNVGRFYLKGQSATGNETITATQPKLYCYREAGSHTLVVRSGSEMMTRCEVYGMDGRLRHIGQFETDEYRFPAQKGVQIVKAYFKDGITSTVKVF